MSNQASYQPLFTLTPVSLRLVAEIAEAIGRLSAQVASPAALRLRRIHRIRTIQGSLAIEGNTLNEEQISAILDGKRVVAPPREIQEARNNAVSSAATPQVAPQVTPQVERLLQTLAGEMSREEIQGALGLQDRKSYRVRYLTPAVAEGLIEMTLPEKPNSRLQKYRLTDQGRTWLQRRNPE
ncbi:MAG: hypothetical protein EHM75_09445 [Desulfobacteraceae bacterium]|nr:MAG: hypothetical protein EHM75_09445 [Desulfobacteraceae bacterium]